MMKTITYTPKGVCSRQMEIDLEDDIIKEVRVLGGCSGNLQGVSSLLVGMTRDEAAKYTELLSQYHRAGFSEIFGPAQ